MSNTVKIYDIDFIDSTQGTNGDRLYALFDEQSASCAGLFTNEEDLEDAIEKLISLNRTPEEIWGEIYIANSFIPPAFSLSR